MLRTPFLAPLLLCACAAAAADKAPTPTEACLAAAASDAARENCVGASAAACRAALRHPDSIDIAVCVNEEAGWWRRRLAVAYETMVTRAASLDEKHAKAIARGEPRLTDDIAALQASWKDWTEKRCAFETMLERGTTRRMIVGADCMLRQTAAQTLLLERSARPRE